jgi:imidazolonepropionase-like amidohydrolase
MKSFLFLLSILFCLGLSNSVLGQVTPAKANTKKILLINGTAHIGNGKVIKRSAIGIENDKIVLVKDALAYTYSDTDYDTIIDIKDKHVYPAFIAPNTTLGLTEIEAVRSSVDEREVGTFNPHVRSIIAYNTDSKVTPTIRTNGVLIGQITPRGGVISGTSSIVQFDAWNWEDAVYKMDDGIHLNWPNAIQKSGWWAEPGPAKKSDKYSEGIKSIEDFFDLAVAYNSQKKITEVDLRLKAMEKVLNGESTLYIHASLYREINDLVNFKKTYNIAKVVIVGGYDAHLHAKKLASNDIGVILSRIHSLPERPEDDVYLPYKLPKILSDANVTFCFQNAGDMEQMGARNLPFYAGTAVAYGLDYEKAVQSLTLNTAKLLGIDHKIGSIEEGKDATLFVSEGDALDMRTNNVIIALIQGRSISLDNHQIRNYEKYKTKFGLE